MAESSQPQTRTLSAACQREGHRYFVADVVGVESEGKAVLLVLCTSCGDSFSREFKVSASGLPLRLKTNNNKE